MKEYYPIRIDEVANTAQSPGTHSYSYHVDLEMAEDDKIITLKVGCFCSPPEENYPFNDKVFEWIASIKDLVNKYASQYGVPPIAIAGALANEYNTRFMKDYNSLKGSFDYMQDNIIPLTGCDPVECIAPKDPDAEFGKVIFESISGIRIDSEDAVNKKLESEYKKLKGIDPDNTIQRTHKQRLVWAVAGDYGKGNFSLRTAYDMYDKYPEEFPIKMSRLEILRYIITDEGAVKFTAINLANAVEKLKPYVFGLPSRKYEAVLVSYYKQGERYINKYLENIKDTGGKRPIGPGEGCGVCKQRTRFADILGVNIKKLIASETLICPGQ